MGDNPEQHQAVEEITKNLDDLSLEKDEQNENSSGIQRGPQFLKFVRILHWNIGGKGDFKKKKKALKEVCTKMNVDVILLTETLEIEPNSLAHFIQEKSSKKKNVQANSVHIPKRSSHSGGMLAVWRVIPDVTITEERTIQWKCHDKDYGLEGFTLQIKFQDHMPQHFLHYVYHNKKTSSCKNNLVEFFKNYKSDGHFDSVVGDFNFSGKNGKDETGFEDAMKVHSYVRVSSKEKWDWTNRAKTKSSKKRTEAGTMSNYSHSKIDVVYTSPASKQVDDKKTSNFTRAHRPLIAHKVYKESVDNSYGEIHENYHKIVVFDLGVSIENQSAYVQCKDEKCFCYPKNRSCESMDDHVCNADCEA